MTSASSLCFDCEISQTTNSAQLECPKCHQAFRTKKRVPQQVLFCVCTNLNYEAGSYSLRTSLAVAMRRELSLQTSRDMPRWTAKTLGKDRL